MALEPRHVHQQGVLTLKEVNEELGPHHPSTVLDEHGILWWQSVPASLSSSCLSSSTLSSRQEDHLKDERQQKQTPQQPPTWYDADILCTLVDIKSSFEGIPRARFSVARKQSNPYENLSQLNPFLNRSALKMANLNYLVNGQLLRKSNATANILSSSSSSSDARGNFRFLDLCGGPGGFSSFVLSMKEAIEPDQVVRGLGITLQGEKGACEWDRERLARFLKVTQEDGKDAAEDEEEEDSGEEGETHESKRKKLKVDGSTLTPASDDEKIQPGRGNRQLVLCYGKDGTGDLCKLENIQHLVEEIQQELQREKRGEGHYEGVDLVMADGGFAAARSRFNQEELMLPLVISEVLAMFKILSEGGHFVCKLFEITLPGTIQVVGLLALLFERIALIKPITSRPASAERYVVCMDRRWPSTGEGEKDEVTALLQDMLLRAQQGHSDGSSLSPPCSRERKSRSSNSIDEKAKKQTTRISMAQKLHALLHQDPSGFSSWLRIVNNKIMTGELQACYAILGQLDRMEEGDEEGERGESEYEEFEISDSKQGETVCDPAYYLSIWGVDKVKHR